MYLKYLKNISLTLLHYKKYFYNEIHSIINNIKYKTEKYNFVKTIFDIKL